MSSAFRVLGVQVWRGELVESEHRVHAAVCDAACVVQRCWGDAGRLSYLRSSAKPIQAWPLVASGAAEAYGLDDAEIAVACASHGAEPFHVEAVRSLLARAGLDESLLRCGAHRPAFQREADALIRVGEKPRAVHNNCSGKHAGMLALARRRGAPLETYQCPTHPVQKEILAGLSSLSGVPEEQVRLGIDGCGAPTFALPLAGAATAFARLGAAQTGSAAGDAAARRIVRAMTAHPEMVAGAGRFDTALMRALGKTLFCKSGAEGVFCIGVPEREIGIVLKVEDGNGRAAWPAAMRILSALGLLPEALPAELAAFARPMIANAPGQVVGAIRTTGY